ncbi:tetratricopeptide repeat protein [Geomonas sp. Red32]|uniref:tetratricopeptide repeat protein n=1 Tax=Geomonas sp. Red32 TaxID=2912856 RepID=UPI00202CD6A3|nr:tetratricopeptide repeat protein [Geomonas sp. Red32]MCM0082489.1 tetratricopeptide repeat protein [Geomonas sp. Red32]
MLKWFRKDSAKQESPQQIKGGGLQSIIALHLQDDLESARRGYQTLVDAGGDSPAAIFLLCTVLVQQERVGDTIPYLDRMPHPNEISLDIISVVDHETCTELIKAVLDAAEGYKKARQVNAARGWYVIATFIDHRCVEAHFRLGDLMHDLKQYEEAEEALKTALRIDPEHWASLYTYGVLCQDLGRDFDAIDHYQHALAIFDGHAKLHNNLGSALLNVGKVFDALPHFQRAVELDQTLAFAHSNMGTVLNLAGNWRAALVAFENALRLGTTTGVWVKHALVMPPVPASVEEIEQCRERMRRDLVEMAKVNPRMIDPVREVGIAPFYLAYHGMNDLPLMEQLVGFFQTSCPQLNFLASHCATLADAPAPGGKIRIGFFSNFLFDHPLGHFLAEVIGRISRDRFEVVVVSTFARQDQVTAGILEKAEAIAVPMVLNVAQKIVADAKLDVLVYGEIGMEPLGYFLAFGRLAPVQVALCGHPVTTAIPSIDYFVSQAGCEPADAAANYSEKLLCLSEKSSYLFVERPAALRTARTRADFDLQEGTHLYLCSQSLFKIHPDMDALFAGILKKDPEAVIIVFQRDVQQWNELFLERLQGAGVDLSRVLFIPRLPYGDYLELTRLVDVVLDTLHVSGGVTSFDAFAVGTPVVTLPGAFMRGRLTLSLYRRMGIDDCVVESTAAYVDKAVAIASDRDLRSRLSARINEASPAIFGDEGMIRELEGLLSEAYRNR